MKKPSVLLACRGISVNAPLLMLQDTERFQSWNQDLERKLVAKEQELEQLAQKQKNVRKPSGVL